jgi:hypothetical protein
VSGDGEGWFLIKASPDLRRQIEARPREWPAFASRFWLRSKWIATSIIMSRK